ncbi:hypothetical protein ACFQ68_16640 [Amycolatopsis japonica]|uniref:hypothetical protein n=1 Tax=Amycolatopsis japonica TaxID=208439 RepID=UPI00366E3CE0
MGNATTFEGQHVFGAAIMVGIGDDDIVDCVAEYDAATEDEARRWIERTLPAASMPDWVYQRPHGAAGVFLFGSYCVGVRVQDGEGASHWEKGSFDDPEHVADFIDGQLRWWVRTSYRR